jgi:hypothetical protein
LNGQAGTSSGQPTNGQTPSNLSGQPSGTLTDEQILQLQQSFDDEFGRSVESILADPATRQRFNQLQMQFRGFGAFNSPQVQEQLNLTPVQQQQLRQLGQNWRQSLARLNRLFATDPATAVERFNQMQQQFDSQLATVLSSQQLQSWRTLVGEPFAFEPTAFLGTGTAQARTSARLDPQGDRVRTQLRSQGTDTGFETENASEGAVGTAGTGTEVGRAGTDVGVGTSGTDADEAFDADADNDGDVDENIELDADADDDGDVDENIDVDVDADDDGDLDDSGEGALEDSDDVEPSIDDDLDGDNIDDSNVDTGADQSTSDPSTQ